MNSEQEFIPKFKVWAEGRPSSLTVELRDEIVRFAETEHTVPQVARLARVNYIMLNKWLRWGKRDILDHKDSIYADLYERYEYAKGIKIKRFLTKLEQKDSFLSITWLLEKCFPEDFSKDSDSYKEIEKFVVKLMKAETKGITSESHINK